jgi:hypothetical protein
VVERAEGIGLEERKYTIYYSILYYTNLLYNILFLTPGAFLEHFLVI